MPPSLLSVQRAPSRPHVTSSASTCRQRGLAVRVAASCSNGPTQDWRSFRARLIAQQRGQAPSMVDANQQLLRLQSPALAEEGVWAHATAAPEPGGLLLATTQTAGLLGVDYWQAVVLLLQCTSRGAMGLILNRPTNARVGRAPSGLPVPVQGIRDGPPNSRLYWGGPHAEHAVTLLHGGSQQEQGLALPRGSREVAPGIHVLFGQQAVAEVAGGDLAQAGGALRFFGGACAWGPGDLEQQIEMGAWTTAAASRSLVLKHCLQLPVPLWRELSCLLGGECAQPARQPTCQP